MIGTQPKSFEPIEGQGMNLLGKTKTYFVVQMVVTDVKNMMVHKKKKFNSIIRSLNYQITVDYHNGYYYLCKSKVHKN